MNTGLRSTAEPAAAVGSVWLQHSADDAETDDIGLKTLARLGAAIERHFGGRQDVEWARAGGELFIVQRDR